MRAAAAEIIGTHWYAALKNMLLKHPTLPQSPPKLPSF